jgi:hypothetical protein
MQGSLISRTLVHDYATQAIHYGCVDELVLGRESFGIQATPTTQIGRNCSRGPVQGFSRILTAPSFFF